MDLLKKCEGNFFGIEGNVDLMVHKISTIQGVLGALCPMKTYTNHMKYKCVIFPTTIDRSKNNNF